MDIRRITPSYSVSEQLIPTDFESVAEAGYVAVICNRPDEEIPASLQSEQMRAHAETAGLAFHVLPLTHQTFTPENLQRQRAFMDEAGGPVLAYCASGTRCAIAWALTEAGQRDRDDILAATAAAGYNLSHLAPMIDALSD